MAYSNVNDEACPVDQSTINSTSIANIRVKTPLRGTGGDATGSPSASKPNRPNLLSHLKGLTVAFGPKPNKHELVTVLIEACIEAGINTQAQIISELYRIGHNNYHISRMLKEGTGSDPVAHRWRLGADKKYSLLT